MITSAASAAPAAGLLLNMDVVVVNVYQDSACVLSFYNLYCSRDLVHHFATFGLLGGI